MALYLTGGTKNSKATTSFRAVSPYARI